MTDATRESTAPSGAPSGSTSGAEAIDAGSYELLRNRLLDQSRTLGTKADALNDTRLELFGGAQMAIAGQVRVRTENNCVPRDIVCVGNDLFFGYNVHLGLRREVKPDDVFSLLKLVDSQTGFELEPVTGDVDRNFLRRQEFLEDFDNLYRYMRNARLIEIRRMGPRVLAVFQVGSTVRDIKAFRWSVSPQGEVSYVDAEGAREAVFPPTHDFEWKATGRDDFVYGRYPHVNIRDAVFVETVGGDLTIKVEDNTEDGQGIYREPVADADQTLDDGKILYAELGSLIILKILPFAETEWRYLVFNTRTHGVDRIDAIGRACIQLPEDHGIIFPGGYYLQSGETKTFEGDVDGMIFQTVIKSPNGEDVMYVFYEEMSGRSILLPYNMIRREVQAPIHCDGHALFPDGRMVVFRHQGGEATRVHPMQIWQTPFCSDEWAAQAEASSERPSSYLAKVGNKDLVRGISDCHSVRRMIQNQEPSRQVYEDLIAASRRLFDHHYWLDHAEVGDIAATLKEVLASAELIVDEFEKVQVIQAAAREALAAAEAEQEALFKTIRPEGWSRVDSFVDAMGELRTRRGKLISLKEMRYMDVARVGELEAAVVDTFDRLTERAVAFLLRDDALEPYRRKYAEVMERIEKTAQSNQTVAIQGELDTTARNLDMLTEVVSSLQIDDPAARTRILEGISEVFALFNRAKATLAGRRKDMLGKEGVAEFGAQFKLFAQSVQSAIAMADSPEKCDEQLTRLMIHLEELEARFSEFDQFLADLAQKREEVYDALNAKKQQLLDERQRRADNVARAADRILTGIGRRARSFTNLDELNAYFAADAMILKIRELAGQLRELGDGMRSEQVIARLKASRDEAARSLRDKSELFEGADQNLIRLGRHRFAVNTQNLELTMLPRDGRMVLNLTGTEYFEVIEDERLDAARDLWDQTLVSETPEVYRGEYLAATILFAAELGEGGLSLEALSLAQVENRILEVVRDFAASRYDEGYERGVHDHDAALILDKLLGLRKTAGLLRFAPGPRALACLFWAHSSNRATGDGDAMLARRREAWAREAASLGRLRTTFATTRTLTDLGDELGEAVAAFLRAHRVPFHEREAAVAGRYLAEELATGTPELATSGEAARLRDKLLEHLELHEQRSDLEADLDALGHDLTTRFRLAVAWVQAFVEKSAREDIRALRPVIRETAVMLLTEGGLDRAVSEALSGVDLAGILGQHPRISQQRMALRLDELLDRLGTYVQSGVPAFQAFRRVRTEILARERSALRLGELEPKVLSSFVRNRLLDEVYLPLIGANLAKQIGAAGDAKRTDLMGMLLLISPPGYGKTTLMEYIANRLGLVFMKINGPALGHSVTSLDPAEAPNATARQELHKLGLALEMGNNVMLYLDDIQHTHPELLQKFISLCDAQRRIEGVWRGRTRTYDMRGKRFCVCMAGNPYTESGDRFQIPDMLANRADVYNLGDVLSGKEEAFALSYIENSITSSAVLAPLATRDPKDIYLLVRKAAGEEVPTSDLSHGYSKVEVDEILAVLRHLFRCRDVLFLVNAEYIASAAQDDRFRTEPRFQLQGSYRNMNKLAEKVVAAMNEAELEALLDDHYIGEAQTLTSGAESNILKLKELRGTLSPEEAARWEAIKKGFARHQLNTGAEDDPVARVTNHIAALTAQIDTIRDSIRDAATAAGERQSTTREVLLPAVDGLRTALERRVTAASGAPNGGGEVAPYLAQLNQVLAQMAAALPRSREAARPVDGELRPILDRLGAALEALAQSRPQPDLAAIMENLGERLGAVLQRSPGGPRTAGGLSDTHLAQLAAVRNSLRAVIESAEARIRDRSEDLPASKVWKQLSEAMEILEGLR